MNSKKIISLWAATLALLATGCISSGEDDAKEARNDTPRKISEWGVSETQGNTSYSEAYPPVVRVWDNGKALAVWPEEDGASKTKLMAMWGDADEGGWDTPFILETGHESISKKSSDGRMEIFALNNGSALVLFQAEGNYHSVFYDKESDQWLTPQRDIGPARHFSSDAASDGGAVISWLDGDDLHIRTLKSDKPQNGWSQKKTYNVHKGGSDNDYLLNLSQDLRALSFNKDQHRVIWVDDGENQGYDVASIETADDGTWKTPEVLAESAIKTSSNNKVFGASDNNGAYFFGVIDTISVNCDKCGLRGVYSDGKTTSEFRWVMGTPEESSGMNSADGVFLNNGELKLTLGAGSESKWMISSESPEADYRIDKVQEGGRKMVSDGVNAWAYGSLPPVFGSPECSDRLWLENENQRIESPCWDEQGDNLRADMNEKGVGAYAALVEKDGRSVIKTGFFQ